MKKLKLKSFYNPLVVITGTLVTIGVSALFISGGLMNTFLKIIPLLGHQIIGWSIIGVYLLGLFLHRKKLFK